MEQHLRPLAELPVATLRIAERNGRALAVCDFPPVLEMGRDADDVRERALQRLRALVADGGGRRVTVVRRRGPVSTVSMETL